MKNDTSRIGPTMPLSQGSGGSSKDMALIGDTTQELHTKSLPRRTYPSEVKVLGGGLVDNDSDTDNTAWNGN